MVDKGPPTILPLLPGLRWSGKLKILEVRKDGYVVQFDAVSMRSGVRGDYIYDRATLTGKQLADWTGWSPGSKARG